MIRVKLYQNKNEKNETVYNKWYPRVIVEETIGLEELSAHMASHKTPLIQGRHQGLQIRRVHVKTINFYKKGRGMICNKDNGFVIIIKKRV